MNKLAPSMLAADFAILGEELKIIGDAGAHYLHIDVMDGIFVNNISFGIPVITSVRKVSGLVFDVHLMITNPERYVAAFAEAGADIINVHVEACSDLRDTIAKIKALNKKAAVTISPDTSHDAVLGVLEEVDMVLVMSVYPGFGGQGFIPGALKKAEAIAKAAACRNIPLDIQMDGGITLNNVRDVLNAGVNVIVAGSSVFGATDKTAAVKSFYEVFKEFE